MALEIHPMTLGEIVVDSSFLVWGFNQGEKQKIPFTSYLILGGDAPIMVDAGARDVDEITRSMQLPTTQTADQSLEANLERFNLRPEEIGTLVLTHLHIDHTGYVDRFPNARIKVQRDELRAAATPYFPPGFFDATDVSKLIGPLAAQVDLLEGDTEIAPGVRTVLTGGHSPAHQMVYVDVPSGQAILTGDNVYAKTPALDIEFPPGLVHDLDATIRAIRKIKQDGTHILPSHDPTVYVDYPEGVR